jgi:hypothetical protein
VHYAASDAAADGQTRDIEQHRERLVLLRLVAGSRMALSIPLTAFTGVALKMMSGEGAVVLAHDDAGLVLPFAVTGEADEAFAEWQGCADVLGLPLMVVDEVGFRNAQPNLGAEGAPARDPDAVHGGEDD